MSTIIAYARYAIWKHITDYKTNRQEFIASFPTLEKAESYLEEILIKDSKNNVTLWRYEIKVLYVPNPQNRSTLC